MKRLIYYICVECFCGWLCYFYGDDVCKEEGCFYFLDLDECLVNRVYIFCLQLWLGICINRIENFLY